jgi:hypothetical protein
MEYKENIKRGYKLSKRSYRERFHSDSKPKAHGDANSSRAVHRARFDKHDELKHGFVSMHRTQYDDYHSWIAHCYGSDYCSYQFADERGLVVGDFVFKKHHVSNLTDAIIQIKLDLGRNDFVIHRY